MDIAIIFLCWIVSFLFAGIEAGLLSINPVRLRHQVKRNLRAAVRLNHLLQEPERLFVTVLLITNLTDILGLLLLTRRLVWSFGAVGFAVALVIAFPVYLFLLGVFPKALFRRFPFRALAPLAGLLEISSIILSPFLEFGSLLARIILAGRKRERGRLFAAREELKLITAQSESEGSLTSAERIMIHNIVDFRMMKARDLMVPLGKVVSARPEMSATEVLELSRRSGFDRLPVITSERKALGLVSALDILLDANGPRPLSQEMRRIVTATDDEPAYRIVQRLRAARLTLAGVLNSAGNLVGIITLEDLIQCLVQRA